MLSGRHILLGVTGSIAAYKVALLVRLFVRAGADVKVVMTPTAKEFISPLTLATLSKHPVPVEFFNPENGEWNSHVSLGLWADLFVIAPASANTIAKMASGIADNLLLTTYLSAKCPVMLAPAMDLDMYAHKATQANLRALVEAGVELVEPASGELASGLDGKGRMEEPEKIFQRVVARFSAEGPLKGRRVLISAGPTREAIDPIRFISNRSTGKMGYAIAREAALRGAKVTLVSGPVSLKAEHPGIELVSVTSAAQMYEAMCTEYDKGCDAVIFTAAVADYKPAECSPVKLKKGEGGLSMELLRTKDICSAICTRPRGKDCVLVGFALETDHSLENALGKLERKGLDMIVLNSMEDKGAGVETDTNKITIIGSDGTKKEFPLKSKAEVASDILDAVSVRWGLC
ncbi:MAG: bifunctional phosphopantothenoylcysteine decarboxylase/phosphopantothenate--cysteine ligase CoaBC [Bacteroidales bacterium]|nr:bifunctional phosphopantothenoylcysteine decarboxylase/phosphopantothenate--cysteine ligase CoaBC [Bacteroidales bacterium]